MDPSSAEWESAECGLNPARRVAKELLRLHAAQATADAEGVETPVIRGAGE